MPRNLAGTFWSLEIWRGLRYTPDDAYLAGATARYGRYLTGPDLPVQTHYLHLVGGSRELQQTSDIVSAVDGTCEVGLSRVM